MAELSDASNGKIRVVILLHVVNGSAKSLLYEYLKLEYVISTKKPCFLLETIENTKRGFLLFNGLILVLKSL